MQIEPSYIVEADEEIGFLMECHDEARPHLRALLDAIDAIEAPCPHVAAEAERMKPLIVAAVREALEVRDRLASRAAGNRRSPY